jgi:hypothetical protein
VSFQPIGECISAYTRVKAPAESNAFYGVYLACALVADDQNLKDSFLARLKQIIASKNHRDFYDAQSLLGGIYRTTKDAKLQGIVKQPADDLDRPTGQIDRPLIRRRGEEGGGGKSWGIGIELQTLE